MTKTDFIDWKSNPTTKEVFNQLRQYIDGLQAELGQSAGIDPRLDAVKAVSYTHLTLPTNREV